MAAALNEAKRLHPQGRYTLATQVATKLWPTPTAQDWSPTTGELYETTTGTVRLRRTDGRTSRIGLEASATQWQTPRANKVGGYSSEGYRPTPTAQDSKNNAGPSQLKRNALPLNAAAGGSLNPDWVEVLMGFPAGFTRLDPPPSATDGRTDSPESLPESPTE